MLVDTHTHLDFDQFNKDRDKVILDAYKAGVKKIINVGSTLETSRSSKALAEEYNFIYAGVGVHPHEASKVRDETYKELEALAASKEVVAIGETGLDYHYDNSPREKQREVFKGQLELAAELDLPVVIHSREAKEDTISILEEKSGQLEGVLHCYAYDLETAKWAVEAGFYIAFGGILTFNSADDLRRVVPNLPLERLLLETDAPYLTPQAYRGERNEPKYVKEVAKVVAELKNTSLEEVAKVTTKNAEELFGL